MTDTLTDTRVQTFAAAFSALENATDARDDARITAAFLALDDEIKESWRALYAEAYAARRLADGPDLYGIDNFDRVKRERFAYSTRNFFAWARFRRTPTIVVGVTGRPIASDEQTTHATVDQFRDDDIRMTVDQLTPWEATIRRWLSGIEESRLMSEAGMDPDWATGNHQDTIAHWMTHPHDYPFTTTAFADWLTAHNQDAPDPVSQGDTTPTAAVPDLNALPNTPEAWRPYYADLLAFVPQSNYSWFTSGSIDVILNRGLNTGGWLVSGERHPLLQQFAEAVAAGTYTLLTTVPEGPTVPDTITADAPVTAEPVVIPIGPDHPGWQAFAQQMAEVATRHGMCPEYDRIAALMDLPTRREEATIRVTIELPVLLERGHGIRTDIIHDALVAKLAATPLTRAQWTELSRAQVVR